VNRRRLALFGSVASLSLVVGGVGLSSTGDGTAASVREARIATAVPPDDPATAALEPFALNALLAPLLDDDEPPRWTDAALHSTCGPATAVAVDGKPMVDGARIPATAFTVRWKMDRCNPFGDSSIELSGIVDLLVFHEDTGLSAAVDARRLKVWSAAGRHHVETAFGASMSLVATADFAGPVMAGRQWPSR
jgi:hypothetical protein